MSAIEVVQKPILKHRLIEIGEEVKQRIEELQLDNQIATIDTVQSLKKLRADLNKEIVAYESDLKTVLEVFEAPIKDVKAVFKAQITAIYSDADALLKDKISFVELAVKQAKKEAVETYFSELCIAEKIDFVTFEKVGLDINLSTTERKYKEQCFDFIAKVVDDVNLIKASNFEAETMVEYKKTLNASKAITTIKERKEGEERELARIKAEQNKKRQNECISLGMVWVDIVNSYDFDANISISKEQIETLSIDSFTALIAETKIKIDATKVVEVKAVAVAKEAIEGAMMGTIFSAPTITKIEPVAPIQAPTVTETPKQMTAKFEVSGTKEQLLALGQYMKLNNIYYKNVE